MQRVLAPNLHQNLQSHFLSALETVHLQECMQIVTKLIMHSFLSSRLWWDMRWWKRLPVLEKFENGRLPKIVQLPDFDKMGSKNAIDLPTRKPARSTAKK